MGVYQGLGAKSPLNVWCLTELGRVQSWVGSGRIRSCGSDWTILAAR